MSILILLFSLFITGFSLAAYAQETSSCELYKSSVLTPVNRSTIGVEGPAVDKNGIVYVTLQDQDNLESFRVDIPGREWKLQRKTKY
jgi:hypothetical protein